MSAHILLGLFDPDDPLPGFVSMSPAMRDFLILFGSLLLVVAVVVGILLFRRFKRRRSKLHRHSRHRHPFKRTVAGLVELKKLIHEKSNRRRRVHRSRNATLAETGGLPPLRSNEPLEPPQPQ